jgi:tetratricopeptide (TPR) repeat protein
MRKPLSYLVVFVIGTVLLVLGVAAGVYQSVTAEQRMPAVDLNDVVDTYLEDVDELMKQGEYERAKDELELVLKLLPRDRELSHDMLGRALLAQQRFKDAEGHFREAIRLDPDFAEAHHDLGIAYARQGQMDQAVAAVKQALRLRPDYPAARENLSRIEAGLGQPSVSAGVADEEGAELERGRTVVRQFYRGELEQIHSASSPSFAERMSLEQLVTMHRQVSRQLGPETEVLEEQVVGLPGSNLYVRRARFERHDSDVEILVQLDGETAVGGLMFRPIETPAFTAPKP